MVTFKVQMQHISVSKLLEQTHFQKPRSILWNAKCGQSKKVKNDKTAIDYKAYITLITFVLELWASLHPLACHELILQIVSTVRQYISSMFLFDRIARQQSAKQNTLSAKIDWVLANNTNYFHSIWIRNYTHINVNDDL